MRPAEVTSAQIIVAGIQLEKQGKAVNGFSLRKHIGAGNPARLKRVWDESAATRGDAQAEPDAIAHSVVEAAANPAASSHASAAMAAEVVTLRELAQSLQGQLEASQNESTRLANQVQQATLVADAVTDQLNRQKLRCAELEGKDKQQQVRIAELNARIDEQRGELHRGSQGRIALQKALDALLDPARTTTP